MAWKSALHSLLESAPLTQYWYVSLVCIVRKSYWLYDAYLTREVGPVNEMCGALLLRPPQTDRASSSPSLIWGRNTSTYNSNIAKSVRNNLQ